MRVISFLPQALLLGAIYVLCPGTWVVTLVLALCIGTLSGDLVLGVQSAVLIVGGFFSVEHLVLKV